MEDGEAITINVPKDRAKYNHGDDVTSASRLARRAFDDIGGGVTRTSRYRRQPRTSRISTVSAGAAIESDGEIPRTRSFPLLLRQMTLTSTRSSARLLGKYRIRNDTHAYVGLQFLY